MITQYGIAFIISLVVVVFYKLKCDSFSPHLMALFICVCITDGGYFAISLSKNVTMALIFNSVSFLGSVFMPLFMFLIIAKLCNIKVKRAIKDILIAISAVMLAITTSPLYSNVFYKDVKIEKIGAATVLVKSYGVLQHIYTAYIAMYILAISVAIVYALVKKINNTAKVQNFLMFVLIMNVCIWAVEHIMDLKFELLSITYIITEVLILMVYGIVNNLDIVAQPEVEKVETVNSEAPDKTINDIEQAMPMLDDAKLSEREKDVAKLLLLGVKRKDIANALYISESTVKKHSANIYKKLNITNRKELEQLYKDWQKSKN